jgi:hypothetical protein
LCCMGVKRVLSSLREPHSTWRLHAFKEPRAQVNIQFDISATTWPTQNPPRAFLLYDGHLVMLQQWTQRNYDRLLLRSILVL